MDFNVLPIKKLWIKMRGNLRTNIFVRIFIMTYSFFQMSCTKMSEEGLALGKFTNKFAKEIQREYGFELFGSGGSVPVKIEEIILKFETNTTSNVTNARKLAIPIALKFIERMNQDKNLRPYLENFPVTIKNISLTLGFRETNAPTANGEINCIMVIGVKNLVSYNIYNEKKTMLIDFHRETFEEAQKILMEEGPLNF